MEASAGSLARFSGLHSFLEPTHFSNQYTIEWLPPFSQRPCSSPASAESVWHLQWEAVPAYEVPPDFDKAVLGAVDLSTKEKARRSLPLAFKRRWLDLRSKVSIPPPLLSQCYGHTTSDVLSCWGFSPETEVARPHGLELQPAQLHDHTALLNPGCQQAYPCVGAPKQMHQMAT